MSVSRRPQAALSRARLLLGRSAAQPAWQLGPWDDARSRQPGILLTGLPRLAALPAGTFHIARGRWKAADRCSDFCGTRSHSLQMGCLSANNWRMSFFFPDWIHVWHENWTSHVLYGADGEREQEAHKRRRAKGGIGIEALQAYDLCGRLVWWILVISLLWLATMVFSQAILSLSLVYVSLLYLAQGCRVCRSRI